MGGKNLKNYVTGVITLDTEDYFKKEKICEMETITATSAQYHA